MTGRCPRCGHEADAKAELLRALTVERYAPSRKNAPDDSDTATARRRRRLLEELDEYGQQRRKGA